MRPRVPGTPTEEGVERTPTEDVLLLPPQARAEGQGGFWLKAWHFMLSEIGIPFLGGALSGLFGVYRGAPILGDAPLGFRFEDL